MALTQATLDEFCLAKDYATTALINETKAQFFIRQRKEAADYSVIATIRNYRQQKINNITSNDL